MQRDLVTVKVWEPHRFKASPKSWIRTGHAVLEVYNPDNGSETYVSFWPDCSATYFNANNKEDPNYQKEGYQCVCGEKGDHFHDRNTDELLYQRPGDKTYHLNSLSPAKIQLEYSRRVQLGLKWRLSASILFLKDDSIANCCSLVYDLLEHAGLESLISKRDRLLLGTNESTKNGLASGALLGAVGASGTTYLIYQALTRRYTLFTANIGKGFLKNIKKQIVLEHGLQVVPPSSGVSRIIYNMTTSYGVTGTIAMLTAGTALAVGAGYSFFRLFSNYYTVKPEDLPMQLECAEKESFARFNKK